MKNNIIVFAVAASLVLSLRAADTQTYRKQSSTESLTNTFAERLQQAREGRLSAATGTNAAQIRTLIEIQKCDVTNRVPDRARKQALKEQQMQQMQREHDEVLKRAAPLMPPSPLNPESPVPRYKSRT